ncbi:deleted in malignant brain tumors 1 protein-like [Conger conger]|uniref:deleted in malignant brain tumors 1 protein-like n=1 Tax=Conger conger TaxID=82655 RepID=UPI002A5B0334|nr:deleted in malignant brain tumors 1 protein-like [Conger conger]
MEASAQTPIRLVNGDHECTGRVEIYHVGQWGTVCDNSWNLNDAEVVCRQAGCGRALDALSSAHFGQGSGPIWLVTLQTQIRLVNGDNECSGRVEIYHVGKWGTVCDKSWNLNDAEVVCRQAGCGRALAAVSSAHFGQGSGLIWLNDVSCSGNESSLTQCQHPGFGSNFCSHYADVGVICSVKNVFHIAIRLVNGSDRCSGRVEIYHFGQWGTVCDNSWNMNDAEVVCRQAGCGRALDTLSSAHFGQGSGLIWLGDVSCSGNESSLSQCQHPGFGSYNCSHHEDAGVNCSASAQTPIRLVDGDNECSGRVEIYHVGRWGTVCDYFWNLNDAEVVCRQAGCGRALAAISIGHYRQGSGPIWLDNVSCSGSESSLTQCQRAGFQSNLCSHERDVGVICSAIRLVNGSDQCSGRVEIYHVGQWGTVCDNSWNMNDAEVVCRQAGCGRALDALSSAHFGQGSGPIWLGDVSCSGNESSLTQCQHPGFGSYNCSHHEDAGVNCSASAQTPIRLVDGDNECSGRVEIYHVGRWGTVCDYFWNLNDAEVVCRQAGCGRALAAVSSDHFGVGSGPIWLDNVTCSGNESSLNRLAVAELWLLSAVPTLDRAAAPSGWVM